MSNAVNKIVALASSLPSSELKTVILKLQALQSLSSAKKDKVPTDQNVLTLYRALSHHLHTQLHIRPIRDIEFFTKTKLAGQVKASLEEAVSQLDSLAPKMSRIEWESVSDLVADLVVAKLRYKKTEVPWRGIILYLTNLPSLLDESFPGYLANSLLQSVLQLRLHGPVTASHVWN